MSAAALLEDLRRRGIALSAAADQLIVQPASALSPADRAAIRRHLAELVAVLTGEAKPHLGVEPATVLDPWDQSAALRLMFDADTLVERLGVDGRHPAIAAAAARAAGAYAARDMTALRRALTEFAAAVRPARSSSDHMTRQFSPAGTVTGAEVSDGSSEG